MKSTGPRSKKANERRTTIVWVDELAFYLSPLAVRTWAPKGQTPTLRVPLSHDHLSVISGITLDGRLFLHVQEHAYTAEGIVAFLQALLDQVEGHLTVIWDGAPIHRSRVVKDFLQGRPSGCIWSGCRATRPSSTRMKASGIISSGWS